MPLALVALSLGLLASGRTSAADLAEFDGFGASFRLEASNGYQVGVSVYSAHADGKGYVSIAVFKDGQSASYTAPAIVTDDALHADLGALGAFDAVLHRSGTEKSVRFPCGGPRIRYEPATYEGSFQFTGEGGYTRVDQSVVPISGDPFLGLSFALDCDGGGRGEALNDDRLPGARLKGVSYAHGRVLKFQVNKNRPGAPTVFTASVRERHAGIRIYRTLRGNSPPSAFHFPHSLRTATLSPPAPFSGRATLTRGENSVVPTWRGDLALDFLGHSKLPIAGSGVYVTLVHARFTVGNGDSVTVGFKCASCGGKR